LKEINQDGKGQLRKKQKRGRKTESEKRQGERETERVKRGKE
jgi:hypothetical protein